MTASERIVGLGEILWDVFPDGAKFGGAPANFAAHCAGLGATAQMLSAVGDDDLGRAAIEELKQRNVRTDLLQVSEHPTGTVNVTLNELGNADYEFASDTAWDNLRWTAELGHLAQQTQVVCFGTLGQRSEVSRRTIQRFVDETPPDSLRIFDVNLRQNFHSPEILRESLGLANVLKLNDEELDTVAPSDETDVLQRLEKVRADHDLRLVVFTRGGQGSLLVSKDGSVDYEGASVPVKDTVGAGDAYTAVVALGMLRGKQMHEIAGHASHVAGYVCTQAGATPTLPDALKSF